MGVFNAASTIAAAIESILSQEGAQFEFIIVDDGSTDGTTEILQDYAKQDARIRLIHKQNEGLTRALIDGCRLAKAPYIARQDADDVSLPGRLQCLMDLSKIYPDAAIIGSAVQYMGPGGEKLCVTTRSTLPEIATEQLLNEKKGPPAHGSVMFSKQIYEQAGEYRPCFYYGQDADLWLRMAEMAPVVFTDKVLYEYTLSPGAISGGRRHFQKQFGQLGQACRQARKQGRSEEPWLQKAGKLTQQVIEDRKQVKRSPKRSHWGSYYMIGSMLESSDPFKACGYFRKALDCQPFAWRPRVKLWRQKFRNVFQKDQK